MSVSSEKDWKRLIFRWTAPEGAAAIALFFALAVLIEYLAVCLFRSYGLADTQIFQLPLAVFTITISPLFHLIPLGVIIVLVSSWTYLTKYTAKVPRRRTPVKTPSAKPRKPVKKVRKKRFKSIRSFSRKASRKFRKVTRVLKTFYHRIKAGVLGIRGVSPVMQRLFFARAAVKSTATVVLIFLVSFLTLHLMGYPSLVHDLVVGLYRGNPSFHGFVIGTIETAGSIGQALSPIGWLASAVNDALISASSGFRGALEGFIISITGPLVELDPMWRYAVCQNIAAWFSAIAALAYGQYTTRLYRRYRR
jgi:hypothetical protein